VHHPAKGWQAIGKNTSLFCNLSKLTMHSLNCVGSVNDSSNLIRVFEKRRSVLPVLFPGSD
jgi:hypothetical protein